MRAGKPFGKFDGKEVLITPRAITAIKTRINTVNLNIRGECYEHRLMKYAERGWAIGVPLMDRRLVNRDHLSLQSCNEYGYSSLTGTGRLSFVLSYGMLNKKLGVCRG